MSSVTQLFLNKSGWWPSRIHGTFNFAVAIGVGTPLQHHEGQRVRHLRPPGGGRLFESSLESDERCRTVAVLAASWRLGATWRIRERRGTRCTGVKSGDSARHGTFNLRAGAGNYAEHPAKLAFSADVPAEPPHLDRQTATLPSSHAAERTECTDLAALSANLTLRGFNDSGQALFSGDVSDGTSPHALFLRNLAAPRRRWSSPGGNRGSAEFQYYLQAPERRARLHSRNLLRGDSRWAGTWVPERQPVKTPPREKTDARRTFGLLKEHRGFDQRNGPGVFLADVPAARCGTVLVDQRGRGPDGGQHEDSLPKGPIPSSGRAPATIAPSEGAVLQARAATYNASDSSPSRTECGRSGRSSTRAGARDRGPPVQHLDERKGDVVFTAGILSSTIPSRWNPALRPDTGCKGWFSPATNCPGGKSMFIGAPQLNNQTRWRFRRIDTGGAASSRFAGAAIACTSRAHGRRWAGETIHSIRLERQRFV